MVGKFGSAGSWVGAGVAEGSAESGGNSVGDIGGVGEARRLAIVVLSEALPEAWVHPAEFGAQVSGCPERKWDFASAFLELASENLVWELEPAFEPTLRRQQQPAAQQRAAL